MVSALDSASQAERVAPGRLWRAGALAACAAAGANGVVYGVASTVGAITPDVLVPVMHQPITLPLVALGSVGGALGATGALALIARSAAHPRRAFAIVAAHVLALSCAGPSTVPGAPAAFYAALVTMHVVAAAVIVGILTATVRGR